MSAFCSVLVCVCENMCSLLYVCVGLSECVYWCVSAFCSVLVCMCVRICAIYCMCVWVCQNVYIGV